MRTIHTILLIATCASCTGESPRDATLPSDATDDRSDVPASRAAVVALVEDLGAFPLPSPTVVGRDGASAGQLGTRIVWTFGDTFLSHVTPDDNTNVRSATAAWSTVDSPLTISEPIDDAGIPNQLIPYTADELAQNRADALNGWALWPGAVIDTGSPQLLVLFQRIKRTNGNGFDGVALGTARLTVGSTSATRNPQDLFARPFPDASAGVESTPLYGSAGVSVIDGSAYFFACDTAAPLNGGCGVARAPVAQADQRDAFTFYDGHGWNADPSHAAPVISFVSGGLSVSFNPYLGRYLAVNSLPFSNDVRIRLADHIEGPWPLSGITIHAAAGGVLAAPPGMSLYLAQEHIALRSPDARQIVLSYARPLGNFRGEVRLVRVTFQ